MPNKSPSYPASVDWDRFWAASRKPPEAVSWSKKRILGVLQPFISKGKKVLDAGCGSGFFSKHFIDAELQVVSCDYSDEALAMTRALTGGRSRVIKLDMLSPQFVERVPEKFDLIFSDGLLEHFTARQQEQILGHLRGCLSEKGVLATFVPNRRSPWQLIRPAFMPGIHEEPFTLKQLAALHREKDLQLLETGGINTFPFAFSPDKLLGRYFGMLLYVIAQKK